MGVENGSNNKDESGRPSTGVISPSLVWCELCGLDIFILWFFHPDEMSCQVVYVDGGRNAHNVSDNGCSCRVITFLNII